MRATKEEKASKIIERLQAKKAAHEAAQRTEQINEKEWSQSHASAIDSIKNALTGKKPLDDEIQASLAKSVCLLTDIAVTDISWLRRNPRLIDAIDASIKALLSDPPNIKLAEHIQRDIHCRLHPSARAGLFASFKHGMKLSPSAVIVCGLGFLFWVLGFLFAFLAVNGALDDPTRVVDSTLKISPYGLLLIGVAGALGGIASIMVRIEDFAYTRSRDPWPFFFFGIFKPIVGAVFAVFIFVAIGAAILPLKIPDNDQAIGYFFLALAFAAGFSERFAGDIVSSMESFVYDADQKPDVAIPGDSGEEALSLNGGGHREPKGSRRRDPADARRILGPEGEAKAPY